jgi:glycosyltransferase involved in cell wall biosynthesis
VVASENATAGVGAVPGRDLLVATSPDRFAQLVLRVLDDEALWRSLSRSGRSYVERQHTWRHVSGQLEALYAEVSGYNFTLASAGVPVAARATAVLPAE